jgi:hypothetical protein
MGNFYIMNGDIVIPLQDWKPGKLFRGTSKNNLFLTDYLLNLPDRNLTINTLRSALLDHHMTNFMRQRVDDDLGNLPDFLVTTQGLGCELWLHFEKNPFGFPIPF